MRKSHGTIYREEEEEEERRRPFSSSFLPSLKEALTCRQTGGNVALPHFRFPIGINYFFHFFLQENFQYWAQKSKKRTRRGIEKWLCHQRKIELIFVFSQKMSDMTSTSLPLPFERIKRLSNCFFLKVYTASDSFPDGKRELSTAPKRKRKKSDSSSFFSCLWFRFFMARRTHVAFPFPDSKLMFRPNVLMR